MRGELIALSGAAVFVSVASTEAFALTTAILGTVILVLHHLNERPSRDQNDRLTKLEEQGAAHDGRLDNLEGWKNG